MATNTLIITVCDVCNSTEEITTYEVRKAGSTKRSKIDLCAKDAAPLEKIIGQAPKPTPGRKRATRATSMADIEALKRAQPVKKTAAKRTAKR